MHALTAVAPPSHTFGAPSLFSNRREFYKMGDSEVLGHVRIMGTAKNSEQNLHTNDDPIRLPADLGNTRHLVLPVPLDIRLWEVLGVGDAVGIIDNIEGSFIGELSSSLQDIVHDGSYLSIIFRDGTITIEE